MYSITARNCFLRGFIGNELIDVTLILTVQTNPLSCVQIFKYLMKRKEGTRTKKSTSDGTKGEKVHKKTRNIEGLVKRRGITDMSSTTALDLTRSVIGNGNWGMREGKVI